MRVLLCIALAGCIRTPSKPVAVAITAMPRLERTPIDCDVPDLPEAPADPDWPSSTSEVAWRRAYVHRRDHDDLLKYVRDVEHVLRSLMVCVEQMRQQ